MGVVDMYILHLMLESEENNMPKVGDKEFAYTPEGIAAAKAEADMTGESMEIVDAGSRSESYELGGKIPGQLGFGERPMRPMPALPTESTGNIIPGVLPNEPLTGEFNNMGNISDRDWFDDPRKGGGAFKKGGKVSKKK